VPRWVVPAVIGGVLAAVGIAFVALGIAVLAHDRRRARLRTARARATITGFHVRHLSSAKGWSVTLRHPVLCFMDEGGNACEVVSEDGFEEGQWERWSVGDEVEVSYDPHVPQNCLMVTAVSQAMELPLLLFRFGAVALILATGVLVAGALMSPSG